MAQYTVNFVNISLDDISDVGGKNASLGEMSSAMESLGINVPKGFAVKTNAFKKFLHSNGLDKHIRKTLANLDSSNLKELQRAGKQIRNAIMEAELSATIKKSILKAYKELSNEYGVEYADVAVRSSATAEDLPNASFAGQQETFLNIRSENELLCAIKKCYASLYTDRAISYRDAMNFNHTDVYLSVGIQKMARTDKGVSGVAFSLDTESGFKDVVLINACYGLGELLVQGSISPDEYLVFKPTMAVIEKNIGSKTQAMVYADPNEKELVKISDLSTLKQNSFCLNEEQIKQLAKTVIKIEQHYSKKLNRWCPVDVEWGFDGINNELYILQARPETIHSNKLNDGIVQYKIDKTEDQLKIVEGIAVGDGVGSGRVHVIQNINEIDNFKEGDVLVTEMTNPDWEPIMKKASAIVTNKGGRTCHAAIVSRELGIPAIVGTNNGDRILQKYNEVTVSCAEGETGYVYKGICNYQKTTFTQDELPEIATPLMLNVASPDLAFKFSFLPNQGIGLAREEFIINNYIKVHPLALLKHREINDESLSQKIKEITMGYESEKSFFISKLAQGISKIAAGFYGKDVIVRFSDFKSNEYRNLLGGNYFEPDEENPMIGWRGASRYYSEEFKQAFELECLAIKKVREEMGFTNVIVMIPFCRTVQDCESVLAVMKEFGLERGKNGLQVYLMAEIPSNFILAEHFAPLVDGFSIGSNDLTQLALGLDRDSALVSHLYDERNLAVKEMIKFLIEKANAQGVKVGICGQAPSDFPEFAQFLVEQKIGSISVTPDSILKTLKAIKKIEEATLKIAS